MRPGISCSARRISLRPQSARPRSATLYGGRADFAAASNACIFSNRTVAIASPLLRTCCDCGEKGWPLRIGIDRQRSHARVLESCGVQVLDDLFFRKPEPHVAHLLLIFLVMVREHVDDEDLRARPADARDFGE